jgi:hypothetical protein
MVKLSQNLLENLREGGQFTDMDVEGNNIKMSLNGLRPTAQDHGTESSDSFVSLS